MINVGDRIPDLPLALSSGTCSTLASYQGRWLVLYFYPKDATPGCTTEGRDFNALLDTFQSAGAAVLGVSRDTLKSHQNFCAKQGFQFDLVSDGEGAICDAFGVIQPKKLYGREYVGIVRSTFLIDSAGRVRAKWQPVKVPGHAQTVLDTLQAETAK